MPTFRLTLAYDGTGLVGWQRQAAGTSIQGLLEDALRDLDDREVTVIGAGRTDAGVHALGQVACFSLERAIRPDVLARALNGHLPEAVRVLAADEVQPSFHARFDARAKHYRYRIWNGPAVSPFERLYVWHLVGPLDVDAMADAAHRLEGQHDFAAFQAAGSSVATTTRAVKSSAIASNHELLTYDAVADGFLRHMVRAIVGTLVEIGRGRHPPGWMDEVLASHDRGAAGPTAPASGLFLVSVDYGDKLATEP